MDFRTRKIHDYIDKNLATAHLARIQCEHRDKCPAFSTCPQLPSQSERKDIKKQTKIFFVFEGGAADDGIFNHPCVSHSGIYFRDKFLSLFLKEAGNVPYLITNLVRNILTDSKNAARSATEEELLYCWDNFYPELLKHKPEVIVAFGGAVFNRLYRTARNKNELPDSDTHGVGKLRTKPMQVELADGYKPTVFVSYAPSYILRSPASAKYFEEDCLRVVNHFCPNKKLATKTQITIDKVELLDTVDRAVDFIDLLTRGLPQNEMFSLAFDTETNNLNKVFNNKFLSWQFTYKKGEAFFIPIEHPEKPLFASVSDKVRLINAFQALLNSSPKQSRISWIVMHNAKFDLSVLYGLFKILPRGTIPIWDTLLGMHWLDENRKSVSSFMEGTPYSLKTLGNELFGFKYATETLAARADGDLTKITFDDLVQYGGSDTILTWHLQQEQMRLARLQPYQAHAKLERFMKYYYSPCSRATAVLECNGLYVAKDHLKYIQGLESPIWNRLERIENIELQDSPEVLKFREQFKRTIEAESEVDYDNIWSDSDDSELPMFNPNKKDQEVAFYLDFLRLKALKVSKKTEKPSLDKEFLVHYSSPEVYQALPELAPYKEYYTTPLNEDDDDGEPVYPKNPLQLILEYRELRKLGTTYSRGIEEMIDNQLGDCVDSRIRASFWLASTDTGRLSSSDPNLQQLPSGRTKAAKEIKNIFQAEPPSRKYPNGTVLVQLDYKTAEVRWAAIFAKDRNLIRLFNEARASLLAACDPSSTLSDDEFEATQLASDIHRRTASLMYSVPAENVAKAMRQASKSITFGLLYGQGVQTLATNNGWSLAEAEDKVDKFFSAFPEMKKWLDEAPKNAKKKGFTETIMGRRRRLGFLFDTNNFRDSAKASRLSMNAPIQGQSSDAGMIGVFQFLQYLLDNKLERRWIIENVVHDSVLVQVPFEDIEKVLPVMQYCFVDGMKEYIAKYFRYELPLPIECDIEIGLKYGDLLKWDGRPATLSKVIEKLKERAKVLWAKKPKTKRPPKEMDLITF